MTQWTRHLGLALAVFASLAMGCVGGAWKQALRDDTPAAYYRFLRDHPDSKYSPDAKARLAFHKVKRRPSLEGFAKFNEEFPEHPLLAELRPLLEDKAFEVARGAGTPEAYREFTAQFPDGPLAQRGEGNAVYLENAGFGFRTNDLASFAESHPASDFAPEAARTASSVSLPQTTRIQRVGLRIDISPATPEAARVRRAFHEAAIKQYRSVGVELVSMPDIQQAGANLPDTILTIHHNEEWVDTKISREKVSRPGVDARTQVTMKVGAEGAPIWDRLFEIHVDPQQHLDQTSVLFGPSGRRYWSAFFVPVARWQSQGSVRSLVSLSKTATAVDATSDRSVVVFEDGDFQLVDLADPAKPAVLASHTRTRDFKTWSGVKIIGGRIAIFGEDGMELVGFTGGGTETLASLDRGAIGSIVAVEPMGDRIALAGNRGLIVTEGDGGSPQILLRRAVRGMSIVRDTLILSDGESVMLSTPALLKQGRVLSQLRLGRDFGPGRVRAFGNTAVVIGSTGVLVLDMTNTAKPRVISKIHNRHTGPIQDAGSVGGRIFLLGDRGLVVLDEKGRAVAESVDVEPRARLAAMGRHVVSVGEQQLQVVDATPFRVGSAAAAPTP